MKYKTVLFDFDGTLADASRGILACLERTMQRMNLSVPSQGLLKKFIGPPLKLSFIDTFDMTDEEADEAIGVYRGVYAELGLDEVDAYPGIAELLRTLNENGVTCAVASARMEKTVRRMLTALDLRQYFAAVCGAPEGVDIRTKADIITQATTQTASRKEDCLLVGDSGYDAIGAQEAGVDFCAVLWGFGFTKMEDAAAYPCRYVAQDIESLGNFLLK